MHRNLEAHQLLTDLGIPLQSQSAFLSTLPWRDYRWQNSISERASFPLEPSFLDRESSSNMPFARSLSHSHRPFALGILLTGFVSLIGEASEHGRILTSCFQHSG